MGYQGIGFTKGNVKHKHLTNEWIMKVQILVRVDRMTIKKTSTRENIHPRYDSPATTPEKGLDNPQVYGIATVLDK